MPNPNSHGYIPSDNTGFNRKLWGATGLLTVPTPQNTCPGEARWMWAPSPGLIPLVPQSKPEELQAVLETVGPIWMGKSLLPAQASQQSCPLLHPHPAGTRDSQVRPCRLRWAGRIWHQHLKRLQVPPAHLSHHLKDLNSLPCCRWEMGKPKYVVLSFLFFECKWIRDFSLQTFLSHCWLLCFIPGFRRFTSSFFPHVVWG